MSPLTKPRLIAYLAGIFIAGTLCGGLLTTRLKPWLASRSSDSQSLAEHIENRLKSELRLDEEQVLKVRPIIVRDAEAIQIFNCEAMQKIEQSLERSRPEFISVLRPDQFERFKKMEADRKAFFEKKLKGRPLSVNATNNAH
jgi:hypothetical protein